MIVNRLCITCRHWRWAGHNPPNYADTGTCRRAPPPQPDTKGNDSCGQWGGKG